VNARPAPTDDGTPRPGTARATSRWLRPNVEVAWFVVVALAVRAAAAWTSPAILNDGATLLRSAERLRAEGLATAVSLPDHPLTPWLVSLAPAGVDPQTAATVLCVLAGALAVWPLHVLARVACGRHAAAAACIVYVALPKAVGVTSTPLTSALLLPLFLAGVSLAVVAGAPSPRRTWDLGSRVSRSRRLRRRLRRARLRLWRRVRRWSDGLRRPARLVGAGLACGLAYLARPEGLVAGAAAVLAALWFARRGRRLASAAVVAAVFVVVAAPYAVALTRHEGRFAVSPKKDVARFVGAAETPGPPRDAGTTVRETTGALDGALTTPAFILVLAGVFLPTRWRRGRSIRPRLFLLALAAAFVGLTARLQAGWGYGGARHVLPGALLLLPFVGEGFLLVAGFISRVVARRRLAVVLAAFLSIPLAVRSVLRPEGENQVDARRLGERLAEIAKEGGAGRVVVATFREPLVAYYADCARRVDGAGARDVPLWGAFHALLERSDAEGRRAELAQTLRREGAQWLVVDMFRRSPGPGADKEASGASLAQRLVEDGVLGTPVVSAGSALTAFPVLAPR